MSVARAFVNHPPLLIADEPTGNLDPDTSVGIMQLLYRINRAGTTVVMATHDREMVDKMRRRVIQLEGGKVVRDDRRGGLPGMKWRFFLARGGQLDSRQRRNHLAAVVTVLIVTFLLGVTVTWANGCTTTPTAFATTSP